MAAIAKRTGHSFSPLMNHKAKLYGLRVELEYSVPFIPSWEHEENLEDGSAVEGAFVIEADLEEALEHSAFAKYLSNKVRGFSFDLDNGGESEVAVGDNTIVFTLRCFILSSDGKQGGIPDSFTVMTEVLQLNEIGYDVEEAVFGYKDSYLDIMADQKMIESCIQFIPVITDKKKGLLAGALVVTDYHARLDALRREVLISVRDSLNILPNATLEQRDWLEVNLQVSDLFK